MEAFGEVAKSGVTGGERDFPAAFGQRIGGVAHQIEKDLDQLIAVAGHRRQ